VVTFYLRGFIKSKGYVGYGIVRKEAVPVSEYEHNGVRLIDVLPKDSPWRNQKDPEMGEWLVKVDWKVTVPESQAKWFKGAYAKQHVVSKIRDEATTRFLEKEFGIDKNMGASVD